MSDIEETAVTSQGPGGQNVNKVATAIQLRFDLHANESLPDAVMNTLLARNDRRITADGVIVIRAQNHRTQNANRIEAHKRLAELIRSAAIVAKPRHPTRPGKAAKEKRLQDKKGRGERKRQRQPPSTLD